MTGPVLAGDRRPAWLAAVWLAACVFIVASRFASGAPIDANIQSILPEDAASRSVSRVVSSASDVVASRVALLVTAEGKGDDAVRLARRAGQELRTRMTTSGLFEEDMAAGVELGRWLFANRKSILCETRADAFTPQTADLIRKQALAKVFGVGAPINGELLNADPFLLTLRLGECLSAGSAPKLADNQFLVSGRLSGSAFDFRTQDRIEALIKVWREDWAGEPVRLDRLGAIFHAAQSARTASSEIGLIGGLGMAGVIVVFWGAFGRVSSALVSAMVIGASCLSGLAATLLAFNHIHALTLVFAAMLVGVVSDYAVHTLATGVGSGWMPTRRRIAELVRPLSVSMGTTVAGFTGLYFLGVDMFRQLAVFAGAGVATAWVLVLFVLAPLDRPPANAEQATDRFLRLSGWLESHALRPVAALAVGGVILVLTLFGALSARPLDDVRQFQPRDAGLMAEQEAFAPVLGDIGGQRFLVTQGATLDAAKMREEAVLAEAPADASILARSRFDPSQSRRSANQSLIASLLEGPYLERQQRDLGLSGRVSPSPPPARLPQWLDQLHVVGDDGSHYLVARVVGAPGWNGPEAPGVMLIDAPDLYTRAFERYRELAFSSLMIAAAAAVVLIVWIYRRWEAIAIVAGPFAAMLAGVYLPALFGAPVSFFSMAAGMVLFGVGVDFAAFAWEAARGRERWAPLSIAISALTTLLSMGLMALSSSAPVRSFGLTVSIGVVCALCFAAGAQMFAKRCIDNED